MKVINNALHYIKPYIVIFILFLNTGTLALAQTSPSNNFTSEDNLAFLMDNDIKYFWETGYFGDFIGRYNTRINYATFKNISNSQCIVILPGRTEGYLKYKELAFDLNNQGFNLFIIDHRGQGLSERMLSNKHKGYVEFFDAYNEDLHTFIESIVKPQCNSKPYLLAHSMGGAIAIRYMQENPEVIKAAVLSSPMISVNTGGIPAWLAQSLVKGTTYFNHLLSKTPWYFIGQGNYKETTYEDNALTHSVHRYEAFKKIYKENKTLQLGGVTSYWLSETIEATKVIFNKIEQLKTPIQVLQSGADSVVDNKAQNDFCYALNKVNESSCPNGVPIVIKDARHELLIEKDNYRNQALKATLAWFHTHLN